MLLLTSTVAASLTLALSSTASAAWESRHELVHETTTTVDIALTPETVLCSHADYSASFLKVLIPELAAITLLDHQNTDAGAPCVAAGECAPFGDHAPADILDDADTTETVAITVRATRQDDIDHDAQTCTTSLVERVDLQIRGVPFAHERWSALGSRPYGDCTSSPDDDDDPATDDPATGDDVDDDKADTYGSGDAAPSDDPGTAGCTAAGTSSSVGLALLVVGLAFASLLRRR